MAIMNKLSLVQQDSHLLVQETDSAGKFLRLYYLSGETAGIGNGEWVHVADLGEIVPGYAEQFWEALDRSPLLRWDPSIDEYVASTSVQLGERR